MRRLENKVHKPAGSGNADLSENPPSLENQHVKVDQESTSKILISRMKNKRVTRSFDCSKISKVKDYKCGLCPYVTIANNYLRSHRQLKHRKKPGNGTSTTKDDLQLSQLTTCEPNDNGEASKGEPDAGSDLRIVHKGCGDQLGISDGKSVHSEKNITSEALHGNSSRKEGNPNNEIIKFPYVVLMKDELDIYDRTCSKIYGGTSVVPDKEYNPKPVIVNTETLDTDVWFRMKEDVSTNVNVGVTKECPKCKLLCYDLNNHKCSFKCDFCTFTSMYKKVVLKHKHLQHKSIKRSKNGSLHGKIYKCDLCAYKSIYIQSIGTHKKKVHNVIGQASEEFLKKKKCIIGSNKRNLFKCDHCSFTAKYIQKMGLHKKKMHTRIGIPTGSVVLENQEIRTSTEQDSMDLKDNVIKKVTNKGGHTFQNNEQVDLVKTNHNISYKCSVCSFASKYRRVVLRHELCQHPTTKRRHLKQSQIGKMFKCDLCSYKSIYIQSIGVHKKKVHNVTGQASERFLKMKRCIIGSNKGQLYKCEHCSFSAKYIQQIGIHKKQMHQINEGETKPKHNIEVHRSEKSSLKQSKSSNIKLKNRRIQICSERSSLDVGENVVLKITNKKGVASVKSKFRCVPNKYRCSFKCKFCPITSKYRKVILKHMLRQHEHNEILESQSLPGKIFRQNAKIKPNKQPMPGKMFKCDLCSYKSVYIQSIGKHKRKIHNVIERVTEEFLMKKKCIIGSGEDGLYKCDHCSFTAKYIQHIGTHKKKMHQSVDEPSVVHFEDAAANQSKVLEITHDAELDNQEFTQQDSVNVKDNEVKKHF